MICNLSQHQDRKTGKAWVGLTMAKGTNAPLCWYFDRSSKTLGLRQGRLWLRWRWWRRRRSNDTWRRAARLYGEYRREGCWRVWRKASADTCIPNRNRGQYRNKRPDARLFTPERRRPDKSSISANSSKRGKRQRPPQRQQGGPFLKQAAVTAPMTRSTV